MISFKIGNYKIESSSIMYWIILSIVIVIDYVYLQADFIAGSIAMIVLMVTWLFVKSMPLKITKVSKNDLF